MNTLIITNNSDAEFVFRRKSGRYLPRIPVGQTKRFDDLVDQQIEDWSADLARMQGDNDFDVQVIDFGRGIVRSQGNLVLDADLSIGTAANPFSQVHVNGDVLMSEGAELHAVQAHITGSLNAESGSLCISDIKGGYIGAADLDDGVHDMSHVHVGGTMDVNDATVHLYSTHIEGNLLIGASASGEVYGGHVTGNLTLSNSMSGFTSKGLSVFGTYTPGSGSPANDDTPTDLTP